MVIQVGYDPNNVKGAEELIKKKNADCCIEEAAKIVSYWTSIDQGSSRESKSKRWDDEPHSSVNCSINKNGKWDG